MKTLMVVGTGGTIAGAAPAATQTVGYREGAVPVTQLVMDSPGLAELAAIRTVQPFAIGSQHMRSGHWLTLARLLRQAQDDGDVDAVVITHGTDTMEETAFFLDLVSRRGKPVVMTGAMRPSTAVSADGPANLLGACQVALDADAAGRGVLVVFNDCVFAAATAAKVHTMRLDAFAARESAAVGQLVSGSVLWRQPAATGTMYSRAFDTLAPPEPLPRVALMFQHVDCNESVVDWHLAQGVAGIVVAGSGNGMLADPMRAALARASRAGCLVVRASRVANGPVVRNSEADPADRDDALGFVASGFIGPLKARILLQCCLAACLDTAEVQEQFDLLGQR